MTTQSAIFRRMALVLAVAAITISGCAKEKKPEETPVAGPSVEENVLGDSDSGKAMGLQSIRFPFDSFALTSEAKSALKANSDILKDKATVQIQVEGHCDARGGIQYNLALGEKRANAVKKYLEDLGVSGNRITVISYGKERLMDQAMTEEAHAKNRRANFVITSR